MITRKITSRDDLIILIRELSSEDQSTWDNSDLGSFMEALSGWIGDCDGYYKNTGSDLDPDSPSWQLFADALQAAKIYE
jgi:hypothetical protein